MSIDAALSRIDQIVGLQQQLMDPTSTGTSTTGGAGLASAGSSSTTATTGATATTAGTTAATSTDAADTTDFANELAAATQASSATALDTDSTGLATDATGLDSDTAASSPSLGESDDSALLSLMSSLSGGTAVASSDDPEATAATTGLDTTTAVQATSPSDPRITAMTQEADSLVGEPYVYGGGHDGWGTQSGYDCSGFVSAVLHAGGYLSSPQDTTSLPSAAGIESGPGQYVTIYDRAQPGQEGHVIIDIDGQFYESGGESGTWGGGGGVEKIGTPSAAYLSTFNDILHPAGL